MADGIQQSMTKMLTEGGREGVRGGKGRGGRREERGRREAESSNAYSGKSEIHFSFFTNSLTQPKVEKIKSKRNQRMETNIISLYILKDPNVLLVRPPLMPSLTKKRKGRKIEKKRLSPLACSNEMRKKNTKAIKRTKVIAEFSHTNEKKIENSKKGKKYCKKKEITGKYK